MVRCEEKIDKSISVNLIAYEDNDISTLGTVKLNYEINSTQYQLEFQIVDKNNQVTRTTYWNNQFFKDAEHVPAIKVATVSISDHFPVCYSRSHNSATLKHNFPLETRKLLFNTSHRIASHRIASHRIASHCIVFYNFIVSPSHYSLE